MTKTVKDAAIMLGTMASVDAKDSTSVDLPVPDYEKLLEGGIKGLRVGIPKEYRIDGAPAEIDALWSKGADWLKAAGAELVEQVGGEVAEPGQLGEVVEVAGEVRAPVAEAGETHPHQSFQTFSLVLPF